MTLGRVLGLEGLFGKVVLVLVFLNWFTFTIGILCIMEVGVCHTDAENVCSLTGWVNG